MANFDGENFYYCIIVHFFLDLSNQTWKSFCYIQHFNIRVSKAKSIQALIRIQRISLNSCDFHNLHNVIQFLFL